MRLLVIGGNGMLGHRLCQILSTRMDVWATFRDMPEKYEKFEIIPYEKMIGQVLAEEPNSIRRALELAKPSVVLNAIGIVKQRDEAKQAIPSIQSNALFPHQLANICNEFGIRVVQISTDCVFSGMRGNYSEIDNPDPVDLYGRSKLLGELNRHDCLTLRTSIIGWQLTQFSSLLSWFASQRGHRIKGYRKAIYSGFSTSTLSNLIGDIVETRPELYGVYHVASEAISKYDLLIRLRDELGWNDIVIDADDNFFCDRSLNGARFTTTTGWNPPSWDIMISQLASEWQSYSEIYK